MQIFRNKGFIKTVAQTCPFTTIPNGLKQHPLPVGIIHSAQFEGFRRKFPDPQTNEIKLWSRATSLFDVQRWAFDVRCSNYALLDVHIEY